MTQENLLVHFVGFIAAIFVLRLARFTFTFGMQTIEDFMRGTFTKYDTIFRDFFLKVDYIVNKWALFSIGTFKVRWHYIVAFLYIVSR